ncbi:hypothetical protein MPER_12733 [Moniliophthora perniciosa FA553]|nr:hypothetical protein MPER_12733 [Moniliophthora perniciosa FA553]
MLNAQKFLPEKASLGQVVDNFCREAYNSLANLTDDDMAKISKDRSIVEVTRGAILDVNKSPLSSVVADSVRKKAMANLSYIEQLADGTRKVPSATPAEQNRAENNPVTKDDNDTLPSDQEQKSEEEVTIRTRSRAKNKNANVRIEKRNKEPVDNAEPRKPEREAPRKRDRNARSNSLPPATADHDTVMADVTKNVDRLDVRESGRGESSRYSSRGGNVPTVSYFFTIPERVLNPHQGLASPVLSAPDTQARAAEEASILRTAAELQQELQLLPFGSLDNKSTTTLVSLYNAATAALASHLFSAHKCLRDYQEVLAQRDEIVSILKSRRVQLSSFNLPADTRDVDMPMEE